MPDEAEALCRAIAETEPSVSVRVNEAKGGSARRMRSVCPGARAGSIWTQRPAFTFDPLLHAGLYYVQDASSMFIHHVISQLIDRPVRYLGLVRRSWRQDHSRAAGTACGVAGGGQRDCPQSCSCASRQCDALGLATCSGDKQCPCTARPSDPLVRCSCHRCALQRRGHDAQRRRCRVAMVASSGRPVCWSPARDFARHLARFAPWRPAHL